MGLGDPPYIKGIFFFFLAWAVPQAQNNLRKEFVKGFKLQDSEFSVPRSSSRSSFVAFSELANTLIGVSWNQVP